MTTVMGETLAAGAHSCVLEEFPSLDVFDETNQMKWLKLPTGAEKPSWGGLFGFVPMIYVFWEPYQKNAGWIEWVWTGLAFAVSFVLAILGSIYWARKPVMQRVCVAMTALAVTFTAYRPSGVIFFIYVAAFAALATGGNIGGSVAIIAGVILLILGEWWLLWPPDWMPCIVAIQSLLLGAAITVVVRQHKGLRQILKTAERERIARDLHDILGHTLSVIILKSELASRLMEHDPKRAKAEIEDVERISRNALSEVREAISGYHAGDLHAEFERAKATLEIAGIAVDHQCEATGMPVAQERVLALVLREAVTNVVRHANAKRCRMSLEKTDEGYRLEVRDDGRGGVHQEGMGMRGMRERVAAIGGNVSWSSGLGTELTITIPIAASADGGAA
jgi:two-component system sensor histidine kinase DesK